MNAAVMKKLEEESGSIYRTIREKVHGLECWVVPCGGGFPDVPSGSVLFYEPDGKVPCEGLYIIRENRPNGKMYVRTLWHEVDKLRLVQTAGGGLYGEEIIIDVKDMNSKYVCCGRVRVQVSPVDPLPLAGALGLPRATGEEVANV